MKQPEPLSPADLKLQRMKQIVYNRLDEIAKEIDKGGPFRELDAVREELEEILEKL